MTKTIDKAAILDAFDLLAQQRRKHWIGGVPDQGAIRGIIRDVAHALDIEKSDVAANIEERTQMALAQ